MVIYRFKKLAIITSLTVVMGGILPLSIIYATEMTQEARRFAPPPAVENKPPPVIVNIPISVGVEPKPFVSPQMMRKGLDPRSTSPYTRFVPRGSTTFQSKK